MIDLKEIQKDRFKVFNGYKLDRWLFQAGMFLVLAWLFFVAWSFNFQLDYYECQADPNDFCKNPFYKPVTWKNVEYLSPGVYGTDYNNWKFQSVFYVPFIVGSLIFLLNHKSHNRGFKFQNDKS